MIRRISLEPGADLEGFRAAVRRLVADEMCPQSVVFNEGVAGDLFGADQAASREAPPLALPRLVADLIGSVVAHRDPERYALLYLLVWRVAHGERQLLEDPGDPLVHRLGRMEKSVRRDLHKMHAFLRFRRTGKAGGKERFVAWFEPEHHILRAAAPFFVDRFPSFDWSIHTPEASAHWDGATLAFGPGGRREEVAGGDGFEEGWRDYYASTFNPARANTRAMTAEMPKKYWRNMPETQAIPQMLAEAPKRAAAMVAAMPTEPRKRRPVSALKAMREQEPRTLDELNRIIAASSPLVPGATQAVLGEGPLQPAIALVGEQPGDHEDLEGRPFVGPAGQLLMRAIAQAGMRREDLYLTNAVKHFKFERRGKKRIHQKPTAGEVKHYRWWLTKELDLVRPRLVVALGATAALALTGRSVPVSRARGPAAFAGHDEQELQGFITVHPSYLLRLPDGAAKAREYVSFVADLTAARELAVPIAQRLTG